MIPLLAASVILSSMIGRTLMAGAATDCGSHKRDVLFMVENTSMNRSEFAILKQALVDIVDTFTISPDNNQVIVATYPLIGMFPWSSFHTDKSTLKTRIWNLDLNSEYPYAYPTHAISLGRYVFGGVDRADASNVALLFAGSELYVTEEDVSKSNDLKENKKVELFCLGVKNANVSQLNQFASLPSSAHVFFSDTYSNLATLVPELAQIACANCSMAPCQGSQICDLSTNTCIDQTPQEVTAPRKECPMNLYERQSYRISGCPVVMTTFAESPIVCAVHCRSTEGCTNFNMAREADILDNCQLLTCMDTDMLTESEDHDFYTPACVP